MGSIGAGAAYNPLYLIHCHGPFTQSISHMGLPPPPPPPRSSHRGSRRRLRTSQVTIAAARLNSSSEEESQQQLNLSVLRFTLGIPGFDESYLPRWIGYVFGSLIVINHFVGSDSVTTAQLRSEVLGLCLAAFSVVLPFLGKFLKGANPVGRSTLPEGNRQIFIMPENLAETQNEDLAWVSYVLLRNTNTMAVLISVQDMLCVRGYWNVHEDAAKSDILNSFKGQIQQIGFSDLKETLYFPQGSDSLSWEFLPKGALSLLVQPIQGAPYSGGEEVKCEGFVLLVSSSSYAYSDNDRAWIRAVVNKFRVLEMEGCVLVCKEPQTQATSLLQQH